MSYLHLLALSQGKFTLLSDCISLGVLKNTRTYSNGMVPFMFVIVDLFPVKDQNHHHDLMYPSALHSDKNRRMDYKIRLLRTLT